MLLVYSACKLTVNSANTFAGSNAKLQGLLSKRMAILQSVHPRVSLAASCFKGTNVICNLFCRVDWHRSNKLSAIRSRVIGSYRVLPTHALALSLFSDTISKHLQALT